MRFRPSLKAKKRRTPLDDKVQAERQREADLKERIKVEQEIVQDVLERNIEIRDRISDGQAVPTAA